MFKKVLINEHQKGLLFKNGRLEKILGAGVYRIGKNKSIEIHAVKDSIVSALCPVEKIIALGGDSLDVLCVKEGKIAVRYVDGVFKEALLSGKYAFFKDGFENTFVEYDTTDVDTTGVPEEVFRHLKNTAFVKIVVRPLMAAVLYIDGKVKGVLEPGTYYFWKNSKVIEVIELSSQLNYLGVASQDILTLDKAYIRVGFIGYYKIEDYITAVSSVDDLKQCLYSTVQLALREFVGKKKLDEILECKEEISDYVRAKLEEVGERLKVSFDLCFVKDIILPGEMREIMNTVLLAEKKAQANVIARREEVASTRALLNTAKLMDENKTLYKLKELEYAERIFENVSNLTINGNGDIISQLASILSGNKE